MIKSDVIRAVFKHADVPQKPREKGLAYAPTNIALCKYWGKRNADLNLPMTSSLSIALPDKGAMTTLSPHDKPHDVVILNGKELGPETEFVKRLSQFFNLFRKESTGFLHVDIKMNIPPAAGLASSACGFASLTLALNDLYNWQLSKRDLSILARLGSGSAARSFWLGFVEWKAGVQPDGMDSYGEPIDAEWPELYAGILPIDYKQKSLSSREAMQRTVNTSLLYSNWPKKVGNDLAFLKQAINSKNFSLLGGTAESNALSMHATMLASWPPICYFLPETIAAMQQVWKLRAEGMEIYFTEDAGPNLKLFFLEKNKGEVKEKFPTLEVIRLFEA